MRMRAAIAFLFVFAPAVALFACASGNDESGPSNDASTDSGTHDSSLADTAIGDAPKDSTSDVADTPHDGPHDADAGTDSAPDSIADVATDSGIDAPADTASDSIVHADAASDSTADSIAETTPDTALDVVDVAADVVVGYRHTILIDGTNDFTTASERFDTTSGAASGYFAYVTWDATNLYVGYDGSDVGTTASSTKWMFAYLDVDPGGSSGATTGETYHTETPAFPAGFRADYYLRWQSSGAPPVVSLKVYSSGTSSWVDTTTTITWKASGNYVELSLPLSSLGAPSALGLVSLWMNESPGVEAAYAGIYSGNFTDGYHASVPTTHYLLADFASALPPNAPSNEK